MSDYEKFKSMLTDFGIAFEEYTQDYLDRNFVYIADSTHKYFHTFDFDKKTGKYKINYINKE